MELRELYQTLDQEHTKGLNNTPHYGMTQREIDNNRADLECDERKEIPNEE